MTQDHLLDGLQDAIDPSALREELSLLRATLDDLLDPQQELGRMMVTAAALAGIERLDAESSSEEDDDEQPRQRPLPRPLPVILVSLAATIKTALDDARLADTTPKGSELLQPIRTLNGFVHPISPRVLAHAAVLARGRTPIAELRPRTGDPVKAILTEVWRDLLAAQRELNHAFEVLARESTFRASGSH